MKISNIKSDNWELSNSRTFMDFLDEESLQYFPGKDDWRKRLCYTMLSWSEKPTSLDIVQFCMTYKIPRSSLYEWAEKYPDVDKAFKQMKIFLGANRRLGSINKKLDGNFAYKDMHTLDPEWDAINKYHAQLKTESVDTNNPITIVIEQMPLSDKVPARKEIVGKTK